MSRIVSIENIKTVNQDSNKLKYFYPQDEESQLESYEECTELLYRAEETVLIASTQSINNEIFEATYEAISNGSRVYIIFKSFSANAETLQQFNKNKTAIIREVPELDNNFIITDGEATLFLNPLSNKENIKIDLEDKESQDLTYWFNHYFWNKAEKEKILDIIDTPKESPYPFFCSQKDQINLLSNDAQKYEETITPCNKSYAELSSNCDKFYISKDLTTSIHIKDNKTIIGGLEFDENFIDNIGGIYKLTETTLSKIHSDIIPFNEKKWSDLLRVTKEETISLPDLSANNIEEMNSKEPNSYPRSPYTFNINYSWLVNPPELPGNTARAMIYTQFNNADKKLKQDLDIIKRELISIIEKRSKVLNFFHGTQRKAKENLNKVNDYQDTILDKLTYGKLQDILKPNGEFETFYRKIVSDSKEFNFDIEKKEKEEEWNKVGNSKREELSNLNKEKELLIKEKTELENNLKSKTQNNISKNTPEEIFHINKEIANKIGVISNTINKKESIIKSIISEIDRKYTTFNYNGSQNELSNLQKKNKKIQQFSNFVIPDYLLPEVGTLFEDNNNYYLQIRSYDELEKANEISKNRYTNKKCKVVVRV